MQRRKRHDARVEPRVADVWDAADGLTAARASDLDRIDPRPMRRVALELFPAGNGALTQLVATADHVEPLAALAVPDGQRQAPVALLGDHPVVHVAQPVELALKAEVGDPADLARDVHQHWAQLFDVDVPLVYQPEDQLGTAPPAVWVAVLVWLRPEQDLLAAQVVDDGLGHVLHGLTR